MVAGVVAVQTRTFLNNEGILTWIFAGLAGERPLDMLFFLKIRPPISALYAPIAPLGLTPFLYVHVALSALGVGLVASLARALGHRNPTVVAVLLALSPLYFASAAAGVQNSEGAVALIVVGWLLVHGHAAAAGVLLGAAVFGRIELAFFALALAAWAAATPQARPFLLGVIALPIAFVAAGMLYHGDPLWPIHYPPSALDNPAIVPSERAWYGGSLDDLISALLALTPVLGLLAWMTLRAAPALERVLIVTALAFVFAIRILPFTQWVYVDASPRYVLPAVPFLCLGIGRALEQLGRGGWASLGRGALLAAAAALIAVRLNPPMVPVALVAAAACLVAAALAVVAPRAATGTLVGTVAAAMLIALIVPHRLPLLRNTHLLLGDQARRLDESAAWIAATVPPGGVVITDEHLLPFWLAERAPPPREVAIRHIVEPDMAYELRRLANPATAQFDAVFGSSRFNYAPWIFTDQIGALHGDVYVVMRTDRDGRTTTASDPPFDRVEWLVEGAWLGGRLRGGGTRTANHAPEAP